MPVIRACKNCGQKNRIPVDHLGDAGRCGNCKSPIPPINEPLEVDTQLFDEIIAKARVVKVDTERYPELAARYNVRGIPNFAVFAHGRLVSQQAGVVNHEQMESWLSSAQTASAV